MKTVMFSLIGLLISLGAKANSGYDYPISDPLAATVIGTPKEHMASLPDAIGRSAREVVVFPDREVNSFFPRKALAFTLVKQQQKAPLVFLLSGTGASHRSAKMLLLERVLFKAGLHVVSLPSPTYGNFIATASSAQVPGHIVQDSADLYRVMELIRDQLQDEVEVSEYYVTGYSLGGAQAAFVAKLDEERQAFDFKKVLMINPPVNLFNSVAILDHLLEDNIPGGLNNIEPFFDGLMSEFTEVYTELENVDFSDDFLYRIYQNRQKEIDQAQVSATIGMSFRISSANMIFFSDVLTNGGYILPKNHQLEKTESTTDYFKVASRISFTDYFNERFYPFFATQSTGVTRESLMWDTSLSSIADYLRTAKKITVVHNSDDIILAPGEINFFTDTFQSRAEIYPRGGHCGNLGYRDNVDFMVNYFSRQGD